MSNQPPPPTGQPPYQPSPPGSPQQPPPAGGLQPNLARALCYLWFVGVIFLLVDPYKNDPEIRFNAWQSLFIWGGQLVVQIVLGIVLGIIGVGGVANLVGLVALIAAIVAAVKAYQGGRQVLPVIGPIAAQQAGVTV